MNKDGESAMLIPGTKAGNYFVGDRVKKEKT
jgi:hypothetical protein